MRNTERERARRMNAREKDELMWGEKARHKEKGKKGNIEKAKESQTGRQACDFAEKRSRENQIQGVKNKERMTERKTEREGQRGRTERKTKRKTEMKTEREAESETERKTGKER